MPSIRGARAKHTLILLDGRRLAYGFNDMVDLRQIPTTMVERIEIVRGPASSSTAATPLAAWSTS